MEPFWEGLGEGFGRFLADFGWILVVLKGSNFEVEVGSRKSGSKQSRGESGVGSSGPNIDRRPVHHRQHSS